MRFARGKPGTPSGPDLALDSPLLVHGEGQGCGSLQETQLPQLPSVPNGTTRCLVRLARRAPADLSLTSVTSPGRQAQLAERPPLSALSHARCRHGVWSGGLF